MVSKSLLAAAIELGDSAGEFIAVVKSITREFSGDQRGAASAVGVSSPSSTPS